MNKSFSQLPLLILSLAVVVLGIFEIQPFQPSAHVVSGISSRLALLEEIEPEESGYYGEGTYYSEGDYNAYSQGTYYSEGDYNGYSEGNYYNQGTYYSEASYATCGPVSPTDDDCADGDCDGDGFNNPAVYGGDDCNDANTCVGNNCIPSTKTKYCGNGTCESGNETAASCVADCGGYSQGTYYGQSGYYSQGAYGSSATWKLTCSHWAMGATDPNLNAHFNIGCDPEDPNHPLNAQCQYKNTSYTLYWGDGTEIGGFDGRGFTGTGAGIFDNKWHTYTEGGLMTVTLHGEMYDARGPYAPAGHNKTLQCTKSYTYDPQIFAPEPQCADGIDNDSDGKTDWEGGDCGCANDADDDEAGGCAPPPKQCGDGADNDGDGKIDFGGGANNDGGCSSLTDDDESGDGGRMVCQDLSCNWVGGEGADECSDDTNCVPSPTHTVCNTTTFSCDTVSGGGVNECSNDTECDVLLQQPPSAPTISGLSSCVDGNYAGEGTLSWTGNPGANGFRIDISEDQNFGSYYSKTTLTQTNTNTSGFVNGSGQLLELLPASTYYARVSNNKQGPTGNSWSVPLCGHLECVSNSCAWVPGSGVNLCDIGTDQCGPPSCSFGASPNRIVIPPPGKSVLSWTCENAKDCSITPVVGRVVASGGTVTVSPSETTIYTLSCSRDGTGGDTTFSIPTKVRVFSFISGALKEVMSQ